MKRLATPLAMSLCLLLLGGCTEKTVLRPPVAEFRPTPVEIEVEVYDPVSGWVWENAWVRVVSAWNEWSDCYCESPFEEFLLSDSYGLAYFSPWDLAWYEVGFAENLDAQAVLGADYAGDEATVLIEVWAEGFESVFYEVDLSWDEPYRFISIPFEAPSGYDPIFYPARLLPEVDRAATSGPRLRP